jgi:hypothetical protein
MGVRKESEKVGGWGEVTLVVQKATWIAGDMLERHQYVYKGHSPALRVLGPWHVDFVKFSPAAAECGEVLFCLTYDSFI